MICLYNENLLRELTYVEKLFQVFFHHESFFFPEEVILIGLHFKKMLSRKFDLCKFQFQDNYGLQKDEMFFMSLKID